MNKNIIRRGIFAWLGLLLGLSLHGQTFSGTNVAGTATHFSFTIDATSTNLSILVPGTGSAFSEVLLKKDSAPTGSSYDFISAFSGQTNALHLEAPELSAGTYFIQVRTPAGSQTHAFNVLLQTNVSDMRSVGRPVSKPLAALAIPGTISANGRQHFRFDLTANTTLRVALDSTNVAPDVYLQRNVIPSESVFLKRSLTVSNDLIPLLDTETTPGAYFVGVFSPSGSANNVAYSLRLEPMTIAPLGWDLGATHEGSLVASNFSGASGDYFFKITTANPSLGAWRTALKLLAGEAHLYLSRSVLPTVAGADFKSERAGSDGFVLGSTQFAPNETWYLLVRAAAGARWTLVSGAPYVQDLGTVADDGTTGSGSVEMGPEGMRFFSAIAPANMLAWRLWLNGQSNSIYLKKTSLPLPLANELSQAGQTLVVPPYLTGGQQYLIGVSGPPGTNINLDSRQQPIVDLPYGNNAGSVVAGFGYTTYRVQVPPQQIAWQLSLPSTNGSPNFSVRRNTVPNENYNDVFSELAGAVTDHIALVPPALSDGTFYVTVYGNGPHQFTLQSGPAVVTDIDYISTVGNDDTNRVGWRYYRVTDIGQQLGSLGWELILTNFAPGTKIALRRNAAPSLWSFRSPNLSALNYYDLLSTFEGLQQPGHQADVWYIGVYNPTLPLGPFTLITRELQATPLTDSVPLARTNRPPGLWEFFRLEVPATVGGVPVLGWDVRLTNVTRGNPTLVIRRDAFPVSVGTSITPSATNWPAGGSWAAGVDWTLRPFPNVGGTNENGRILAMGLGRPLEPGIYYVGVINPPASPEPMSYSIISRWIGTNLAIPVRTLGWVADSVTNAVAPREADYYQVVIPPNTRSWKVRLTTLSGEAMLVAVTNRIPNVLSEKRVTKAGKEQFVLLPPVGQDFLVPGITYLAVIGEGQNPPDLSRIGTNLSTYVLQTLGEMPETNLGTLGPVDLLSTGALEGGEAAAYHFDTVPGALGFWISLENRVGNPVAVSRGEIELADPGAAGGGAADPYGNDGGEVSGTVTSGFRITVADPYPTETIMLKARQSGGLYPDAGYTLRVEEIIPQPVAFNGGFTNVINQDSLKGGYYTFDVPPGATGWDLRLTNVTSGSPQLVVARDFLPIFLNTLGVAPASASIWPSSGRWAASRDWTERSFSAAGLSEDGRILAMGLGRPLEPGRYYAAVLAGGTTTPMSYTLVSRGIGAAQTIPVIDLSFNGGSSSMTGLTPREAAYFRIQIPTNTPSWKVRLSTTNGEAMLVALKDTLPNVLATPNGSTLLNSAGRKMQKLGEEYFLLLPPPGSSNLTAGTYYLAVVGEGTAPAAGRVGPGTTDFTLTSVGPSPIRNLGVIGFLDLVETNSLAGGDAQIYQFTVPPGTLSMEARLDDRVGNPVLVLRPAERVPDPGAALGSVPVDFYGHDGGEVVGADIHPSFLNVPNPSNSIYTLVVMARATSGIYSNASYTLRLNASGSTALAFDQGTASVTNQPSLTWRYFRFVVPTNALGWDLRLINVITGTPRLVIRRETLPNVVSTTPWSQPGAALAWPTNAQWAPGPDWTRRSLSADGLVNEDGRIFAAGLGRPLEPGTYYVGVINSAGTSPMTYTLLSRGMGPGFSIPVTDVPFAGSATNLSLNAREAAYYRVVVPSNTPSWKVKLAGVSGESMLVALRGAVPNIDANVPSGQIASGKGMQKLGNDHFVLLPATGLTNLTAGTNYFAVVSEGVNPVNATRIGAGGSSFVFTSQGALPTTDLGFLTSDDVVQPDVLEGGEVKAYQILIPPGMLGFKVRLENRVGNPTFVLRQGDRLPDPGASVPGSAGDPYGNEGGYVTADGHASLFTMPNPVPGIFTLMVKARANGANYPDASYTLRLQEILVPEYNFSADLNTNGLTHSVSGLLDDNERVFYKFIIPASHDGQPVIGWKLDLAQSSGVASMRVRRDGLPSDLLSASLMPFASASAIIVPPYLTNGVWYVEVKGLGSTAFTLTSSALSLERPAWPMPVPGSTNQTPGLSAPMFGDTGLATNGVPLPGDQSIFLQQGFLHYYAVEIPGTNSGLLRAQLEAVSGNPDLYLRFGAAPTLYHNLNGVSGTVYDRSMLANATEYANWVPLDGKIETKLKPGLWFMAVRAAGNANARYRLRLSTGNITDIPVHGSDLTNQLVAGGDWRYYRVPVPTTLPGGFNLTFSQQSGDVVVHLRDTLPPGNGATGGVGDYRDWALDAKNHGPYLGFDAPGTYSFPVPAIRPGHVYYFGVRGVSDSVFSIRATTNGVPNAEPATVPFYGGVAVTNLAPFTQATYRIDVPPEATRWKHIATHVVGVLLYLEQGTLPTKSANDDWRSAVANSTLNQYLLGGTWPWLTNQSYYLILSNSTALAQDVVFALDGKNAVTDDNDADGLADAWELTYFGNTGSQSSAGDPDRDGVTNFEEYQEGTNPNDAAAFRPRLFTAAANGTISRSPDAANFALGSQVTITAQPAPGYAFVAWSGQAGGQVNPLVVTMDGHKTIGASFKPAGDDFITALPLSGSSATVFGTNVGMSKEPGEPNHHGNPGGKSIWWRWTAPSSGAVTITTAGSSFNTLLGIYTGPTVSNLTTLASDNNSGGTSNRSVVSFTATAGTTYHIAVDGFNGASSRITLGLRLGTGSRPQIHSLTRLVNGTAQFVLTGNANRTYIIEATGDFVLWTVLPSATTDAGGTVLVSDPAAAGLDQRFYRSREP